MDYCSYNQLVLFVTYNNIGFVHTNIEKNLYYSTINDLLVFYQISTSTAATLVITMQ